MKNLMIVFVFAFVMTGCTLDTAIKKGAKANDDALIAAEFVICRGASIGAILRRYGKDKAAMEGWKLLCNRNAVVPFKEGRTQ